MDWKKTFKQGQWIIHFIFIISILAGIGLNLFAFRLNHMQINEEEKISKVNSLILELKQDNTFEKIGKNLSWAESNKAHDKMRELTRKIAETEEVLEIKAGEELSESIRTFNKLINNNSSISNPGEVLKVLGQKVNSLHDVATAQKYKNVLAITEKMIERLGMLNPKNVSTSNQVQLFRSDLKRLQQLVSASSLDENEKTSLNSRFDSMTQEVELLENLNSQSRHLNEHVTQAGPNLAKWLLEVENKAQNIKGMRVQKQNLLIIMLSAFVGFLVVAWMGMAYIFRWQKIKMSAQVEGEVKGVIEKGIMGDQRFMIDHYSDVTRDDIIRLLDDLKVKLNLGTLLHEGLPFAGCMIDHDFKLTWHNSLFLDQLYLSEEEVRSDTFNWDYVRDYLNLEEDPIYQAIVNKIAGIYPVKVKQDDLTPAQPYEMYVTPVSANRESRVMVFFYPLVSVKDAIDEQVELTRTSINKFISLWNENQLDENEIRRLEKDFINNDLNNLYTELLSVYKRVNNEKMECLVLIRNLEKENQQLDLRIKESKALEEEKKILVKEEAKTANELRNSFVISMEKTERLIHINKQILQRSDDYKNEASRLYQVSLEAVKKGKESAEILSQVEIVKTDYKKLKFELMEVKVKLISMNNSLLAQLPPFDENQQKLVMRYKDELARLDFNVSTLDKKLSQLDILIAKLSMIHEKQNIEQGSFNFQTSQKDHELREAIFEIQKDLNHEETKILGQFKNLHELLKKDLKSAPQLSLAAEDLNQFPQ